MRTAIDSWMEIRLVDGTLLVRASDTGGSQDENPGLQTLLAFVDRSEEEARRAGETHVESGSKTQGKPGGRE
jgi:hypothetical protein